MILFKVPGIPRPWPKENNAISSSGRRIVYHRDPTGELRQWRELVAIMARSAIDGAMFERGSPLVTSYEFYCPKPPNGKYPYMVTKPDLDNLGYAITNTLQGIAYADDCQIVHRTETKIYADGFEPHAIIKIEELEQKP